MNNKIKYENPCSSHYSHYGGGSHEKVARRIQRVLSSVEDSQEIARR